MSTSFSAIVFFSSLLIVSSLAVVFCSSPIFSVLFLVLCFFNASGTLLVLGIEFIPISFIVIYVGAIAVLFLFVVMMLNIKYTELKQQSLTFLPVILMLFAIFSLEAFLMFSSKPDVYTLQNQELNFFAEFFDSIDSVTHFVSLCYQQSNISSIGIVLFVNYAYSLILSGYVLLVAMVATIALTLNKLFVTRSQSIYLQVLTDHELVITKFS
jgi:NADH-quinone oxidoreductase subunit J